MGVAGNNEAFQYDAFISYSRKDIAFAEKLEKALEHYKPPKDLDIPQRSLNVFRDGQDMIGTEYYQSIDRLIQNSAKLIVICSPNSLQSKYVNNEIKRFVKINSPDNIVPIIIAGVPDNEATPEQENEKAFPKTLMGVKAMPLGKDYRGFDVRKDKINKSPYENTWYALLSNIYGNLEI